MEREKVGGWMGGNGSHISPLSTKNAVENKTHENKEERVFNMWVHIYIPQRQNIIIIGRTTIKRV